MAGESDSNPLADLEYLSKLNIVTDFVNTDDTVLDVGGGMGHYSLPLASRVDELCMLDLSHRQCRSVREAAQERGLASDIDIVTGDMRSTPFPKESYDVILCLGRSLSHIGTDISGALTEFNRIGTRDSKLVATTVNRTLDHGDLAQALLRFEGEELVLKLEELAKNKRLQENLHKDSFGSVYKFAPDEIASKLETHGFEVLRTHATDRHTMLMEPLLSHVWDDPENRAALLSYEKAVSQLPWFHNSGNMTLQIARLESKI